VLVAGGGAAGAGRRAPADSARDELGGRLLDEQRVVEAVREAAGEQEAVGVGLAERRVGDVELARSDEQADVAARVAQGAPVGLERAVEDDVVGRHRQPHPVAHEADRGPGEDHVRPRADVVVDLVPERVAGRAAIDADAQRGRAVDAHTAIVRSP
jgi:hypothetical protein